MKNQIAMLFAAGLVMSGSAESLKLPAPDMDSGLTVMKALKVRHSERSFAESELSESELSGLLWAANGFNRPDKRTNATGMNKQTIVLYVCMKSGAYRYDAKANELVKVSGEDLRPAVAGRQGFAATAPVSVVIAADTSDPLYKGDRITLSCYDAGIVSGNIYLYCAAQNLATVCRATMDRDALKKGLGLGDNITLHLNHPVGHFVDVAPVAGSVAAFDSRIASDAEQASKDGFVWKDAAAFPLESKVCASTATPYGRIPADMMDKVPPGVKWMAGNSTGHYFLLETDSPKFGVRWKCVQTSSADPYIPPQGMYGIDIYMRDGAGWRFLKNGRLGGGSDGWEETRVDLVGKKPCRLLVYLPIRAEVLDVKLGVVAGSKLAPCGHESGITKPVVHYGTSLVHGGCASRPGLVFTSQAARSLDLPYVNLGFSGCARLEPIMADVMARADASLYIVDTAWNCTEAQVSERAEPFLRRLHALRPDVPILLCEGPEASGSRHGPNVALKAVYDALAKEGSFDGKLSYLPAAGMLPNGDATHDYVHPNDTGSATMAAVFTEAIAKAIGLR